MDQTLCATCGGDFRIGDSIMLVHVAIVRGGFTEPETLTKAWFHWECAPRWAHSMSAD